MSRLTPSQGKQFGALSYDDWRKYGGAEVAAVVRFLKRRDGIERPSGITDHAGRWHPDISEGIVDARTPSRAYPWSLLHACRTLQHCAELEGADLATARKLSRRARQLVNLCLKQGQSYEVALLVAFPDEAAHAASDWLRTKLASPGAAQDAPPTLSTAPSSAVPPTQLA